MDAFRLLDDEPLRREPRFSFERIVDGLIGVIRAAPRGSSLSICVSGTWGTGKTTVLRSLQTILGGNAIPDLVDVWFAPWKLSVEEVRIDLVRKILAAVQADASFLSGGDIAFDRVGAVRMLAERVVHIDPASVSTTAQWAYRARGTFLEVEDLFRRIASAYLEDGDQHRRIVVLVDDLDRCPPGRVAETLETVKLFMDLPGLVFVFALDREQVERIVQEVPPGMDASHARTYLDKFFQLTFPLPRKDMESLVTFLLTSLDGLGLAISSRALAMAIVNTYDRNLRNLKLFVNRCAFQSHLLASSAGIIDAELTLKWLYLESAVPSALTTSLARGSFGLIVALEYVAFGAGVGFGRDEEKRYGSVAGDGVDWVAAVLGALVADVAGLEALSTLPLIPIEREVAMSLVVDGSLERTLAVLREGNARLVDQDLAAIAYLARTDDPATTLVDQIRTPVLEEAPKRTGAHDKWDAAGDSWSHRDNDRAAYLCYLQAHTLDESRAMYWTDMASAARRLGHARASMALLRAAIERDSDYMNAWIELANIIDVQGGDTVLGNVLYRRILEANAGSSTTPYNYAMNLERQGEYERAFLAALDASAKEKPGDDRARRIAMVQRLGVRLGRADLQFDDWNEGLEAELEQARSSSRYPPTTSESDRSALNDLVAGLPTIEDCRDELNRLLA